MSNAVSNTIVEGNFPLGRHPLTTSVQLCDVCCSVRCNLEQVSTDGSVSL